MDKVEAVKVAEKIAESLGEVGDRPRAQIARIVGLMGEAWTREVLAQAMKLDKAAEIAWTKDRTPRTRGGVFFAVARALATPKVLSKEMARRDFFRCFTDRAPAPKEKKASAPRPPPPVKAPRGGPGWRAPRQERRTVTEVYVARRPLGQKAGQA